MQPIFNLLSLYGLLFITITAHQEPSSIPTFEPTSRACCDCLPFISSSDSDEYGCDEHQQCSNAVCDVAPNRSEGFPNGIFGRWA